jgi:Domain of unknown function (DUF4276)
VRKDIVNHLKEDHECLTTTMVDFYALPQDGDGAWPGRRDAGLRPFSDKAFTVEAALSADIRSVLGEPYPERFIPFVMMHEFEGLLFSDAGRFAYGIGRPDLAPHFKAIRDRFTTPEEINDSANTAPSKRVEALIPGYQKPLLGVLAAREVGLDAIRRECPHFREWLVSLETWCAGESA